MALVETLVLLALAIFFIYIFVVRKNNYWAERNIPFEKPIPLFGNFFDTMVFKRTNGEVVNDIYKKFKGEKVVGIFNFTEPCLLVCDPTLAYQIYTTNFHQFQDNAVAVNPDKDPVLARDIFVLTGQKWKRSRQRMSPAFTAGKIKANYEKIQSVADKLVDYLEKNPEGEVKWKMSLYASEIVATWGMSIDGHAFENPDPILPKLGKLMFEPNRKFAISTTIMTISPMLTKLFRIKLVPNALSEFFTTLLRDVMEMRTKENVQQKDYLQYLMDLKTKMNKSSDTDEQINRLYVGPVPGKRCTETTNLDLGDGRTLTVEKGTTIHIPYGGIQRDPEYWPEPEKFNPDRFIDFTPAKGTYLPFGEGPRICIGMRFASASVKTAAAYIIRNFELMPTKDTPSKFVQEPKHFMSMLKGGVYLKFVKRDLKGEKESHD